MKAILKTPEQLDVFFYDGTNLGGLEAWLDWRHHKTVAKCLYYDGATSADDDEEDEEEYYRIKLGEERWFVRREGDRSVDDYSEKQFEKLFQIVEE